jgi:hypothetical protein
MEIYKEHIDDVRKQFNSNIKMVLTKIKFSRLKINTIEQINE